MSLDLQLLAERTLAERPQVSAPTLRGAELVHLAEEVYVRLFVVTCVETIVGVGLALWISTLDRGAFSPTTIAFAAMAAALALTGLARPHALYLKLRSRPAVQLAPAALGALAVLIDGPESACWWLALPLLNVVCVLSSTPLALVAAAATAVAYVAGTLLGGQPLASSSDLGVLPAAFTLPAYALLARVITDGFARFVLGGHRRAREVDRPPPTPVHVSAFVPAPAPTVHAPVAPAIRRRGRGPSSRLTARQLEVTHLLRDGLRQTEIAACLGISVRQVERLIAAARERVGAVTTTQLVAMLAMGAFTANGDA